jgi:flagellar M-ring protein FliF
MASLDPSEILSQLIGDYLKLPLFQKILFPLLIAASVVSIIAISRWATKADTAVLFSGLDPGDAAAIVERLKTLKVQYEVQAGGTAIGITPPEAVHELRLSLASDGLPKKGNVGYEIFDVSSVATTSFVEWTKFIRAKQGELERTIGSIDAVSSVRVHISLPEKSVFQKTGPNATASVLLKLRPGGELDKKRVKGIANLVAGSVEGLLPENVSIIDTLGNLLTESEEERDGSDLGGDSPRLQYQREIEKGYVQRIEQMLQRVIGPGRVVARVTADLDFSSSERQEESYDPSGQVIRSERSVAEGSASATKGGVPGVVSNLTNDPKLLAPQSSDSDNNNKKESVKNYEVSKAIVKSTLPRGTLTRLSAAVLVDGTYEEEKVEGAPSKKVFKSLSQETLAQIDTLVKSAIGYEPARGDTVTVENLPFFAPDTSLAETMNSRATQDLLLGLLTKGGPILFILLFFLIIVKPLVRFLVTPTEAEVDLQRLLPTGVVELEKELEQERAKAVIPALEPTVDMEQLEELLAENSRIVKDNPHQAALLIRYWLNDGRL